MSENSEKIIKIAISPQPELVSTWTLQISISHPSLPRIRPHSQILNFHSPWWPRQTLQLSNIRYWQKFIQISTKQYNPNKHSGWTWVYQTSRHRISRFSRGHLCTRPFARRYFHVRLPELLTFLYTRIANNPRTARCETFVREHRAWGRAVRRHHPPRSPDYMAWEKAVQRKGERQTHHAASCTASYSAFLLLFAK